MIVFSSDNEILKIFQKQVSRKNEKKLTTSPIELVQTAIERPSSRLSLKQMNKKNYFLKIFLPKKSGVPFKY
jgi:hypothetical protein